MHRSLRYLKQMRHGKIITPQAQYADNYVRPYFTLTDDKSFITFLFFQVFNFFLHRFFYIYGFSRRWNARSYDGRLIHAIQQMTAPMTTTKATAPATPIMT